MNSDVWGSTNEMDMGTFSSRQWKQMREELRQASVQDPNWQTAANWMVGRLKLRYLDPIKRIPNNSYGPGFTIATVLCSLIEHIASLEQGYIYFQGQNPYAQFGYYKSERVYIDFLRRAALFDGYFFTGDGSPPPFCAKDFYKNVRCALVHEACTKNNWRINTIACGYENPTEELFTQQSGIKRLYRDILVKRMNQHMELYVTTLSEERSLQFALARKLDSLCEITSQTEDSWKGCEWWQPC